MFFKFGQHDSGVFARWRQYLAVADRRGHCSGVALGGRLSGLTKKGRDRQEQERQGLAESFENQRMKQHRDLAALQERQAANEQKARLRNGQELKAMPPPSIAFADRAGSMRPASRPSTAAR